MDVNTDVRHLQLLGTVAVGSGRSIVGRGIAHLEHVVAGRQTGVSHAVLACRQGCPLLLESFHAIAVDTLRLIAIMQGGELYIERFVALSERDTARQRDVLADVGPAGLSHLVVHGE